MITSDPAILREFPDMVRLTKRMLRAGVSRFHPDPMNALKAAKRVAKLQAVTVR
jgi:hypothetical protein